MQRRTLMAAVVPALVEARRVFDADAAERTHNRPPVSLESNMTDGGPPLDPSPGRHPARRGHVLVVLAAILLGQAVLFGPSLVGSKILLPLDILGQTNHYLPHTPSWTRAQPENYVLSDQVLHAEPNRLFAARELAQGRFPLWNPYGFAGAPHVLMRFSPFMLLRSLNPSPLLLPWVQVLVALLAGLGAYALCRVTLQLGAWPSTVAGACFPVAAYFVFWQGYGHTWSLAWLPWLLLAEERAIRRTHAAAGPLLALLTCLVLVSGPLDTGAQELGVAGLFALWTFIATYGKAWRSRSALRAGLLVLSGWVTGLLLTAPEVLSTAAYARTGARVVQRSAGALERSPVGLSALPLLVLPNWNGTPEHHGVSIAEPGRRNPMESVSMGYAGALAILLLAPLAWQSRRHRRSTQFFTGLAVLGLGYSVGLPGLTALLRLPGLNMVSHNRLLFATALATTALAAMGLDAVERGEVRWRPWHWIPALIAAGLGVASAVRATFWPASVKAQFRDAIRASLSAGWMRDTAAIEQAKSAWTHTGMVGACLCGLAAAGWLVLRHTRQPSRRVVPWLGLAMVVDLLYFGHGWNVQSDPALYYPPVPMLEQIAQAKPGRVLGYDCLPSVLPQLYGLPDVRGYDAVDPQRLVSLLGQVAAPSSTPLPYAALQWYKPLVALDPPAAIRLPPILDMLNVSTVIFRGTPPSGVSPSFVGDDYWALPNPRVLPRAFVPLRLEFVPSATERLSKLAAPEFDARKVAYIEQPLALPSEIHGQTAITSEVSTRVTLLAQMETPGLVVLADHFDPGWRAFRQGEELPIVRVNHALRGMIVPAGESRIELRYWPWGFGWGFRLAGVGLFVLLGWSLVLVGSRLRRNPDGLPQMRSSA